MVCSNVNLIRLVSEKKRNEIFFCHISMEVNQFIYNLITVVVGDNVKFVVILEFAK